MNYRKTGGAKAFLSFVIGTVYPAPIAHILTEDVPHICFELVGWLMVISRHSSPGTTIIKSMTTDLMRDHCRKAQERLTNDHGCSPHLFRAGRLVNGYYSPFVAWNYYH